MRVPLELADAAVVAVAAAGAAVLVLRAAALAETVETAARDQTASLWLRGKSVLVL